uniref:Mitochondrial chaperone BCS1 n=1 Tax=Acrobeloides nanus TaxID=290746 RepID=A0A914EAB2_9BILA
MVLSKDLIASSSKTLVIHSFPVKGLVKQILANPVVLGGITLAALGSFWYFWDILKDFFRQNYLRTLVISSDNIAFHWVIDHINKQSRRQTQNLSLDSKLKYDQQGNGYLRNRFHPGYGTHYFYYKDRWITVTREKDKSLSQSITSNINRYWGSKSRAQEWVNLTTYGGSPNFWDEFLQDASKDEIKQKNKGLSIERFRDGYWEEFGKPRRKRPLESVILDGSMAKNILKDITEFIESSDWYIENGVPYRRGYLFYGPPGTGKTSFIAALASHFGYSIRMLSLNEPSKDTELNFALNDTPKKTFILLEDIDAAFSSREDDKDKDEEKSDSKKPEEPKCKISFSGLLNAIDGVASAEGRIIFMTTNYKERLDSALIRPGRVDFEAYFDNCTKEMVEKMFQRFYKNQTDDLCREFINTAFSLDKPISPAQLQRYLTKHKQSPLQALEHVSEII